ncbi:threonine ammonia-lyase [Rugosimonospora africana]|uniref:threonine ammonia-lyase n=1 Tax=Rugosimonospora africana TaxID=556532 RepID=A0A8J3VNP1_9ACTN|nr:threonine/serine dehydratase [Rugosimonospora africana]GIH13404.1 serine/threonine dehydratase [Rugosimonospora africana]
MDLISLDDVNRAADVIEGVAVRTPLLPARWAQERGGDATGDGGLWLKPESLQPIGAFKIRGAYHAIASLPAGRRAAGVIAHSSGNHAQAVAYAARAFSVPCVVVMPNVSAPTKIAATEALGARVVLVEPDQREIVTSELAEAEGYAIIPPYDHPDVIAGQGTVGLEIVADLPIVDVVLVPVGGGGLASGVATAVKALRPSTAVIGVEPELAADAQESLREGRLISWSAERTYRTAADGLRTPTSELTLAHLAARLDGIITVSEDEILDTVGQLARSARLVVEPSGAVSVAGYLHHRSELPPGLTVAVISGGNIDPALLARLVTPAA